MRKINREEMAKGYQEMAEINLTIAEEFSRLIERESLYEMGGEESGKKAE